MTTSENKIENEKKSKLATKLSKEPFVIILALISCFLWGSAFPAIKVGYELFNIAGEDTYSKILFAGIRFTMAGLIVLVICILGRQSIKLTKQQFVKIFCLGLLQTSLQYVFFYIGLSNTSGTNGSILSSVTVFFSVIIAHIVYKNDKMDFRKIAGLLIGFSGIVVLNIDGLASGSFNFVGDGFLIISSFFSAIGGIYTKKVTEDSPTFPVSAYQLLLGGLVLVLVGITGTKGQMLTFTMPGTLLLIYMAFLSAIAFSLWTVLLKYNKVSKISVYKFSNPIFGVILSYFLISGEQNISFKLVISTVLVIVGIIVINIEKSDKSLAS